MNLSLSAEALNKRCFEALAGQVKHRNFTILASMIEHMQRNLSSFVPQLTNCPYFHGESSLAQTCNVISSLVNLGHVLFVLLANKQLKSVYGAYILVWLSLVATRDLLLFGSSYLIPTSLLDSNHSVIGSRLCVVISLSVNFVELLQHFLLTVALAQIYWVSRKRISCSLMTGFVLPAKSIEDPFDAQLKMWNQKYTCHARPCVENNTNSFESNVLLPQCDRCGQLGYYSSWIVVIVSLLCTPAILLWILVALWPVEPGGHLIAGYFSCNDFGICLTSHVTMIQLPILLSFIANACLCFVTRKTGILQSQGDLQSLSQNKSRLWMLTKIALVELFIWLLIFWDSFFYQLAVWHFYNLLNALRSIFLLINFLFSRPVLEVFFRVSDPLSILKISNLAFPLPMSEMLRKKPPTLYKQHHSTE
ncbi:hypothetical protein Ciccas_012739 [Cichlidogyrus casuarinus]|uniref:G-protein coupled receptors family 1 profile domain-containing protein n=1 Tax=Cichlidogyrus casuarinus TaxID=1844966 RepID=A0ABD2PNK7_9PLAT